MAAVSMNGLFEVADVLNTERDEKTGGILLQTGDAVAGEVFAQETELWQQPGFCSRPPKAVPGKNAAQALSLVQPDRNITLGFRDVRTQEMYGQLGPGEFCAFAPGENGTSQGRVLGKKDGSINLVTTDTNTPEGKTLIHRFSPEGLQIATPWGGIVLNSEGIKMYTNDTSGHMNGWIELKPSGEVVVAATSFKCPSGNVLLGVGATQASACAYGATPANLLSTTVFVSP